MTKSCQAPVDVLLYQACTLACEKLKTTAQSSVTNLDYPGERRESGCTLWVWIPQHGTMARPSWTLDLLGWVTNSRSSLKRFSSLYFCWVLQTTPLFSFLLRVKNLRMKVRHEHVWDVGWVQEGVTSQFALTEFELTLSALPRGHRQTVVETQRRSSAPPPFAPWTARSRASSSSSFSLALPLCFSHRVAPSLQLSFSCFSLLACPKVCCQTDIIGFVVRCSLPALVFFFFLWGP